MQPQLHALTGLRFWLALWVVVFHQSVEQGSLTALLHGMPGALRNLLQTGYVAVGFFFVLSGFVLAYSYPLSESFDRSRLRRFFAARFARIYPVYLLGILMVAPFMQYPPSNGDVVKFWFDTTVLGLNLTLMQSWIPHLALTWNFPGWSLSNEAFFYCTFPFLGPLLWRHSHRWWLGFLALFLWMTAMAFPAWTVLGAAKDFGDLSAVQVDVKTPQPLSNFVKFHPLLRLAEFLSGILCARLFLVMKDSGWSGRGSLLTVISLLFLTLAILNAHHIPYPLMHNGFLLPAVLCLLLGLALGGGAVAKFLAAPPSVFLGSASYALYILHIGVDFNLHAIGFAAAAPLLYFITYLAVIIVLSCVVYRWFEEPLNRNLRRRLTLSIQQNLQHAPQRLSRTP